VSTSTFFQFVEPRAFELALGSESAWEGVAFQMPRPGDPNNPRVDEHSLVTRSRSYADFRGAFDGQMKIAMHLRMQSLR
jgi:hypothetical protein